MRSEATIHLVYPPDHSILEKRPSIGCDLAKMKPLRTPRADEPKKSWTKLRKTADTNWYQLTSIAKPTGWTHIPACGL